MNHRLVAMRLLLGVICAALLAACASIGRPEGGPRDETPPVFVSSNPAPGALNVNRTHITLTFDENVQISDASSKVVVSPAQKTMPSISAGGRHVNVELRDTLVANATYTIDFADAIKDLNEGNVLDGLAIDFSTGDEIDTLRISGMVLEARTLEPAQGMLVGVYSNPSDTAITTLQLERIAKTNQLGQFTVRGLKPGTYRIFALNDVNRDYRWDRSEDIAFYDTPIEPSVTPIELTDTFVSNEGPDSLAVRSSFRYLPDDILLTWFNEGYASQYLRDNSRKERRILHFEFGTKSDTFPDITLINGPKPNMPIADWSRLEHSVTRDTLNYWIADTALANQDTLLLSMRYLRTDTANLLSWTTDTLKLIHREQKQKKKDKDKDKPHIDKAQHSDSDSVATPPAPELNFLTFQAKGGSTQEVNLPLRFEASQPIDTILTSGLSLEMQVNDSTWSPITLPPLLRDSTGSIRRYSMAYDWKPGARYRFMADSAAIVGLYHEWNRPIKYEFTVRNLEDYSALILSVAGTVDSIPAVAELLSSSDKTVASAPVINGVATFKYVQPGTYYVRLFIDNNGNSEWDTGSIADHRQPEEVYYFPKKLNLRKNWDVEQSWNIYELALDKQKPNDIKKNKPKTRDKDGETDKDGSDEDNEDEWGNDGYGYGSSYGSSSSSSSSSSYSNGRGLSTSRSR